MTGLFNKLLKRSDEYGQENGRPSRPGGELRNLVDVNAGELIQSGFTIDEDGFLKAPDFENGASVNVPKNFAKQLQDKCEHMSMNPMEYVERKIYSYAHLHRRGVGSAYESSIYSGMLFNSYC